MNYNQSEKLKGTSLSYDNFNGKVSYLFFVKPKINKETSNLNNKALRHLQKVQDTKRADF